MLYKEQLSPPATSCSADMAVIVRGGGTGALTKKTWFAPTPPLAGQFEAVPSWA